jgi:hypothetical protein
LWAVPDYALKQNVASGHRARRAFSSQTAVEKVSCPLPYTVGRLYRQVQIYNQPSGVVTYEFIGDRLPGNA